MKLHLFFPLVALMIACKGKGEDVSNNLGHYHSGAESIVDTNSFKMFNDGYGEFLASGHQTTDFVFAGKFSLKLDSVQPYGMPIAFTDVEIGEFFEASVWIRDSCEEATLIASAYGYTEYDIRTNKFNKIKDSLGWSQYFLNFTVETEIDTLKFYLFSEGEVAYFDNFEINRYDERPAISMDSVDVMKIYIPDSCMTLLNQFKTKALQQAIISDDLKEYVTGFIVEADDSIPIEIRLKGDWTDHLENGKTSYRINADRAYKGLSTFSIQHPSTRNYMHEWFMHELCDLEGLLSTSYDFLPVQINGVSQGIYAIEEHFDKELLENRNYQEGPIIKFDESGFWALLASGKKEELEGSYPYFESAKITCFKEGRTEKSTTLSKQFDNAATLLSLFKNLYDRPEQLFDLEKTAKYYALMDIGNIHHAMAWHNRRYYYNPVTAKLEVIGFDMIPGDREMNPLLAKATFKFADKAGEDESTMDFYLFSNPKFREYYTSYCIKYSSNEYLENAFTLLESEILKRESILGYELPNYKLDKEFYYKRAEFVRSELIDLDSCWNQFQQKTKSNPRPKIITPNYVQHESAFFLPEISLNIYASQLDSIHYKYQFENYHLADLIITGYSTKAGADSIFNLEKNIPLSWYNGIKQAAYAELVLPHKATKFYFTVSNIPDEIQSKNVFHWQKPIDMHPRIELSNRFSESNKLFSKKGDTLTIKKGNHILSELILVPEKYSIIIEAGTSIDIVNKGGLIFNNQVSFNGTEEEKITITSSDSSSKGISILSAKNVTIEHTEISNLGNLNYKGWSLNGALTIYEADVKISHLTIKNNLSDDALNIIRGKFEIDNLTIMDAEKDAFDSDYSDGTLTHPVFVNTPNDCVDSTGSHIQISDMTISNSSLEGGSAGDFDAMRIENEIKLTIPDDIVEEVWIYLQKRYDNSNLYLKEVDSTFNSKVAEDLFTDQYFDNDKFDVLKTSNGIRHRSRIVLTDASHKKNGRQLMQLKVNNIGSNILNRAEYKYPIWYYDEIEKEWDGHPFLGIVKRKYRDDLVDRLKNFGVDALELHPTILCEQLRQRIYLYRGLDPFATMTLDHVTAYFEGDSAHFTELELELNEINYTESDTTERLKMEAINDDIKADILKQFPSIFQDQTPKYNKSAKLLNLTFETEVASTSKMPKPIWIFLGAGSLLIIAGIAFFYRKKRQSN